MMKQDFSGAIASSIVRAHTLLDRLPVPFATTLATRVYLDLYNATIQDADDVGAINSFKMLAIPLNADNLLPDQQAQLVGTTLECQVQLLGELINYYGTPANLDLERVSKLVQEKTEIEHLLYLHSTGDYPQDIESDATALAPREEKLIVQFFAAHTEQILLSLLQNLSHCASSVPSVRYPSSDLVVEKYWILEVFGAGDILQLELLCDYSNRKVVTKYSICVAVREHRHFCIQPGSFAEFVTAMQFLLEQPEQFARSYQSGVDSE